MTTKARRPSRAKKKAAPAANPHVVMAEQYARDVVAGRIPACRYVRLACQRHLDGLKEQSRKAYPYRLDVDAATKVCRYVEMMPHVKGKWVRARELIHLSPWQVFATVSVFGWLRKSDGMRRYRRVYIEAPRKNGKSSWTAALALYMMTEDGEPGSEVYSGATSEKQAWEVFGPARTMALKSPLMCEHYGVTVGAKNMHVLATNSKCEPIIGKPGDGASPSFSITDEYHEHSTSEQYDTMVTGMLAREQPIAWVITTAGFDTAGPCYSLRSEAINVLDGTVDDDRVFTLIYTLDEGDAWSSEAVLWKANPNMGVSVSAENLIKDQRAAVGNPREQAKFKTKHLNIWVTAASPYFDAELWRRLGDAPPESEMAGVPCVIGLDLASKLDIAAVVRLHRRTQQGKCAKCHGAGEVAVEETQVKCDRCDGKGEREEPHYYAYGRFYIPKSRAELPELRTYAGWVEGGYLIATPGDITDYDYIEADITSDAERFPLSAIGADQYNATQLITHLQGVVGAEKVVEVPQTVAHLSEPMKEVQALIVDGRLHHDGNPCFAWMIGNVTAQEDRNQNVFPRKERPESKIDGAVALIIAVGRAITAPDATPGIVVLSDGESVPDDDFDDEGIW